MLAWPMAYIVAAIAVRVGLALEVELLTCLCLCGNPRAEASRDGR